MAFQIIRVFGWMKFKYVTVHCTRCGVTTHTLPEHLGFWYSLSVMYTKTNFTLYLQEVLWSTFGWIELAMILASRSLPQSFSLPNLTLGEWQPSRGSGMVLATFVTRVLTWKHQQFSWTYVVQENMIAFYSWKVMDRLDTFFYNNFLATSKDM